MHADTATQRTSHLHLGPQHRELVINRSLEPRESASTDTRVRDPETAVEPDFADKGLGKGFEMRTQLVESIAERRR